MAVQDRSYSDVFQDILHNVQEIVRSEVRLAKTEVREEAQKAKVSAAFLGGGAVVAIYAILFLLLGAVYAMALVMPAWAAALTVGAALAVVAMMVLSAGLKQFRVIHPTPQRTVETIKENVEWARQQTK